MWESGDRESDGRGCAVSTYEDKETQALGSGYAHFLRFYFLMWTRLTRRPQHRNAANPDAEHK